MSDIKLKFYKKLGCDGCFYLKNSFCTHEIAGTKKEHEMECIKNGSIWVIDNSEFETDNSVSSLNFTEKLDKLLAEQEVKNSPWTKIEDANLIVNEWYWVFVDGRYVCTDVFADHGDFLEYPIEDITHVILMESPQPPKFYE